MNEAQAATILGIAAGFDRYIVLNPLNTAAWYSVLKDFEFSDVQSAVTEYYAHMWDGKAQLAPRTLLDDVTTKIAADVRLARRLGFAASDWPTTQRLSGAARQDLEQYRSLWSKWNQINPLGFNPRESFEEWVEKGKPTWKTRGLDAA